MQRAAGVLMLALALAGTLCLAQESYSGTLPRVCCCLVVHASLARRPLLAAVCLCPLAPLQSESSLRRVRRTRRRLWQPGRGVWGWDQLYAAYAGVSSRMGGSQGVAVPPGVLLP